MSALVEELKEEVQAESRVGAAMVLGTIRDMERQLTELERARIPAKIEGQRIADMAELKGIHQHLAATRKALKQIHQKVVAYMEQE